MTHYDIFGFVQSMKFKFYIRTIEESIFKI